MGQQQICKRNPGYFAVSKINVLHKIFISCCLLLSLFIVFSAPFPFQFIFIPVALYLGSITFGQYIKNIKITQFFVKSPFLYYNFIVITIITLGGFIGSKTSAQFISASLFTPLLLYFGWQVLPKRKRILEIPSKKTTRKQIVPSSKTVLALLPSPEKKFDENRRTFIKLIGSAGLSLLIFSLFTKKAHAAFFGSVPGPGTVALKDTTGAQVDPAIKSPTDGYKISQIDDASPAYYGFVNKAGAWFILKEDSSGNYRYTKGASNFSTNWTNRASLTYDYFNIIFA